jgi:hypothetical protein
MPKKIKAEISAKPIFDSPSVATGDGGTVYLPGSYGGKTASKSGWILSKGTAELDWGTDTATIYDSGTVTSVSPSTWTGPMTGGVAVGSGWSSTSPITGSFTAKGTWTLPSYRWESILTPEQKQMVLDVVCEEIARR